MSAVGLAGAEDACGASTRGAVKRKYGCGSEGEGFSRGGFPPSHAGVSPVCRAPPPIQAEVVAHAHVQVGGSSPPASCGESDDEYEEAPFVCEVGACTFTTTDYGCFVRHVCGQLPAAGKPFVCEAGGCGYAAATRPTLDAHTHTRPPIREVPFVCGTETGSVRVMAVRRPMSRKMRMHTGGKKLRACDVAGCAYATTDHANFVRHTRVHTGERPFVCGEKGCTYASRQRANLAGHLRTHTGEKPFACEEDDCGYATTERCALVRHIRTHTGEKPFSCEVGGCGFSASDVSSLVRHTRTHTGEKPYACTKVGCTYAAADRSNLVKHARRHAAE